MDAMTKVSQPAMVTIGGNTVLCRVLLYPEYTTVTGGPPKISINGPSPTCGLQSEVKILGAQNRT